MFASWHQSRWRTLEGRIGEMCELLHTRNPRHSNIFLAAACGVNSMNNLSQPPQPAEPDMALLYLGSLFETLALPPEQRRGQARCPRVAHLRQTSENAARTGHQGQGGEAPPALSLDGRLQEAPALRSSCSCRDRVCDAARLGLTSAL